MPTLAPFSLDAFREMAHARWGNKWAALNYYFSGGTLTTVYVDSENVQVESAPLSDYDQYVLRLCTSTRPDEREAIYRGTVRGNRAPALGAKYLRTLSEKLIPRRVHALRGEHTLIIAPHGSLHRLPFHALMDEGQHLLERFTFVYTPNLEALTQLYRSESRDSVNSLMLLAGLDDFGNRARALKYTLQEVEALKQRADGSATTLYQSDATRRTLLEWSENGELAKFGMIHLATHAIAEPRAPHWSRILLADDDLTVLDVMDLKLAARLVTLSGCSSALGEGGDGDELVGLARAFFYAGARALVASLWSVEDESTRQLMEYFYGSLKAGVSPASALRGAQLKMIRAGGSPFQWAPFVAIGAA